MTHGNKIRILTVAGACLILAAAMILSFLQTDHEKEVMDALSMECTMDGETVRFRLWENEQENRYYLFLPACFQERKLEFLLRYDDGKGTLKIDDAVCKEGTVWIDAGNEEIHQITLDGPLGITWMEKTMQVVTSGNVPALLIYAEDEQNLVRPEEFPNKKYIETGSLTLLDPSGSITCNEKLDILKVRGNLTATLSKKPFTFSLEKPGGLCGMRPALKWNLLANATDGSCIRNKVALDLANACTDTYEPDGEFVEVYLNGQYQGLYLLTEAVEICENRLEISPDENWFLEIELDFRMEEDKEYITTSRGQIFAVHSSRKLTHTERKQLQYMLDDIESALFSEDGISLLSGKSLSELLDMESWAVAWLVQEISADHDTGIASQFAYTLNAKEPPLYAGPVWDFDGTMGNVNTVMFANPAALTTSVEQTRPPGNANQNRWLAAMYRNPDFQSLLKEKYRTNFRENLEKLLSEQIDGYAQTVSRSAVLDALRWNQERLQWMFALPEGLYIPEEGDYTRFAALESHIDMVKNFLRKKKNFLDRLWIDEQKFFIVEAHNDAPFLNQDYNQTLYYWVEAGSCIEALPFYEESGYLWKGYRNRKNGEIVTETTPILEDCILDAVWEQTGG